MYSTASHLILHGSRAWCSRGYPIVDVDQNTKRYGLDLPWTCTLSWTPSALVVGRASATAALLSIFEPAVEIRKARGTVRINTAVDQTIVVRRQRETQPFRKDIPPCRRNGEPAFLGRGSYLLHKETEKTKIIGWLQKVWRLCGRGGKLNRACSSIHSSPPLPGTRYT